MSQHSHIQISKTTATRKPLTLPVLASVLLHGVIIVAIAAPLIKKASHDSGMATSLISQADFRSAEAALKAHHDKHTKSPDVSQNNLERYDAYPVTHSASQYTFDTQVVTESDSSYQPSFDDDSAEIEAMRAQALANANQTMNRGFSGSIMNDGSQTADAAPGLSDSYGGTSSNGSVRGGENANANTQTQTTPAVDINAARESVNARITSNWTRYPDAPNQMINFRVNIDNSGNVTGIDFGAGHRELRESAESAVRASAPFSELAGVQKSFNMRLETK